MSRTYPERDWNSVLALVPGDVVVSDSPKHFFDSSSENRSSLIFNWNSEIPKGVSLVCLSNPIYEFLCDDDAISVFVLWNNKVGRVRCVRNISSKHKGPYGYLVKIDDRRE